MELHQESRQALHAAWIRACHYAYDTPRIFDDPVAHQILTVSETEYWENSIVERLRRLNPTLAVSCPDRHAMVQGFLRTAAHPAEMLSRARYAEDRLEEAVQLGVGQYVLVGAGMETFALRRPDLNQRLQVFEVDRPAAQAFKRQRLAEVGFELPPHVHFVPADLAQEDLAAALARSAYDPRVPTFFGWLGVTMYLDRDTTLATLQAIRRVAVAGTQVVFDYLDTDAFDPDKASKRIQEMLMMVQRAGEAMRAGFDPGTLGPELARIGFHLREHLSPHEIEARYFQGRTDGFHATEHAHCAWATVE
jgi:methyltransferase (TIGR00027 family)